MALELKITQGVDLTLLFWPHTVPSSDPDLVVRSQGGPFAYTLAAVHASATVTAIASDRRTLTISTILGGGGMMGDKGGTAILQGEDIGDVPVLVTLISGGDTVLLAEPLPNNIDITTTTATLAWTSYTATIGDDVSLVIQKAPFTISWTSQWGGSTSDYPAENYRVEGIAYVVRQPFETGVTDRDIRNLVPGLATQVPGSQSSWEPQIQVAERQLIRWLRRDLAQYQVTEDACNGAAFAEIHANLVVAAILADQTANGADRAEARDYYAKLARDEYAAVMASIPWLDLDGDGNIDDGETGAKAQGLKSSWASGFFTSSGFDSSTYPIFRRGQSH